MRSAGLLHHRIVRHIVRPNFHILAVLLLACTVSPAAHLSQPAKGAFDSYIAGLEVRLASYDSAPAATPGDAGAVHIEPVNGGSWAVSGALIHHWRGTALVPGVGARDMLALLRDYNHFARYYAPEVSASRALSVDGDAAVVAMRFRKQEVIMVVLDAEFQSRSGLSGPGRGYSVSRSIHFWQVDRPGTPQERRRPEGDDDGFLWRLNSYWRFQETGSGLLIECQAVSLTRDVPVGLGWLITPIIQTLPRSSLEFTLASTREALIANQIGRHPDGRAN